MVGVLTVGVLTVLVGSGDDFLASFGWGRGEAFDFERFVSSDFSERFFISSPPPPPPHPRYINGYWQIQCRARG